MALFNLGKKEEEKETCCCCEGETKENVIQNTCCGECCEGVCCVKVLGSGCKSCHALYENAKQAVHDAGFGIEVEYVTDMETVMRFGVMSMPALVVNDKVVSTGKILKPEEIKRYFE